MKCPALFACLVIGLLAGCSPTPTHPFEALAGRDYFVQNVKPLLETRCLSCHREAHPPAGLSLVQRSALYAPRRYGRAYVVPGDPMASLLLTSVAEGGRHPHVINRDPLLTPRQVDTLYEWIEDGAYWPENPDGFLQPRRVGQTQSQTTATYRVVEYSK